MLQLLHFLEYLALPSGKFPLFMEIVTHLMRDNMVFYYSYCPWIFNKCKVPKYGIFDNFGFAIDVHTCYMCL